MIIKQLRRLCVPAVVFCGFSLSVNAATFPVTTTADDGAGSLRQAILDANSTTNSGGPDLISFAIAASGVQTISPTNALPAITDPVVIDGYTQTGATSNTLANGDNALLLIELIGTNAGVVVHGLSVNTSNTTVRGLAIGGFDGSGIELIGDNNTVEGNFIGTDPTGTIDRGNGSEGIGIGGSSNLIGGATPAARNLIAGNTSDGIELGGGGNNLIQGNFIGTDASGTNQLGNAEGVNLAGASNATIGGTNSGAGNLISGNNSGGIIIQLGSGNLIQGNFIGTDVSGTLPLGNNNYGVQISAGGSSNTVGGAVAAARNLISGNAGNGVQISTTNAVGNVIWGNSILDNLSLGIDLGSDGVTSNDVADADTGANLLQNFPVLSSASNLVGSIEIVGSLASSNDTTFALEFFANSACDPSGFGEGELFIGATNVTTDASGTNAFTVIFPGTLEPGAFVTATATDPAGNTSEFSPCVLNPPVPVIATCSLAPLLATNFVGALHSVTVTVTTNSNPASGVSVNLAVLSGPNAATATNQTTDAAGQTSFSYTGNGGVGTDIIQSSGSVGGSAFTCTATKVWISVPSTNQPPIAVCRNVTTNANANCQATVPAAAVDNGSSDPDGDPITRTLSPSGPYALGSNVVMLVVADDQGETNACSATITVVDQTPPTVNCPATIITNVPNNVTSAVVVFPAANVTDNCSVASTNYVPASGSSFPLGTNTVTRTAIDGSGNTNSCQFLVIVRSGQDAVPHDMRVVSVKVPKKANLKAPIQPKNVKVKVTIQNRAARFENITNEAMLANLVSLEAQSLGICAAPTVTPLISNSQSFPISIAPFGQLKLTFRVTIACANDPLPNAKGQTGHEDYRYVATINHPVLDGETDAVPADDVCPRPPSGADKGCGNKDPVTRDLGADLITDVIVK